MTTGNLLHTSFLDLLFENRNKAYGAYRLRRYYPQRLAAALVVALGLAAALLLAAKKLAGSEAVLVAATPDDVVLRTVAIPQAPKPPEIPKPVRPTQPAAPVAQAQFTQIRITSHPVSTGDVPTQSDLINSAISNTTSAGLPATQNPIITTGVGNEKTAAQTPAAAAYVAPQFPGGAAAWAQFLSRNLQAPDALEEGEKKTVVVNFLVAEDGLVTGFDVVQSGGAAFDAEVIRVLKKMPKWKPALRSGVPAAVSFTQPVTFVAMGD